MLSNTAKQFHELFVKRFNVQDADAVTELCEPDAVILPSDVVRRQSDGSWLFAIDNTLGGTV